MQVMLTSGQRDTVLQRKDHLKSVLASSSGVSVQLQHTAIQQHAGAEVHVAGCRLQRSLYPQLTHLLSY